jgi:hypothetical protein
MVNETATQPAAPSKPPGDPHLALVYGRVLNGDTGLAQVWFHQSVLDKYRSQTGARVIRSNNAGRVKIQGGWALDFGIAGDDTLIHASVRDLADRLPAAERRHWLGYITAPAISGVFVTMRIGAGHCIEDGDTRDWSA